MSEYFKTGLSRAFESPGPFPEHIETKNLDVRGTDRAHDEAPSKSLKTRASEDSDADD